MKNLNRYVSNQRNHQWQGEGPVLSPEGDIVLIISAGDIRSYFTQLAQSVGVHTFSVYRHADVPTKGAEEVYGSERLETLLPLTDMVAMVVPRPP